MTRQSDSEMTQLRHRIGELEAENRRLRDLVAAMRHDRAEYQELLRREIRQCSAV